MQKKHQGNYSVFNKKIKHTVKEVFGAHGETRTLKRQFSTASETATFTNFATWALMIIICRF